MLPLVLELLEHTVCGESEVELRVDCALPVACVQLLVACEAIASVRVFSSRLCWASVSSNFFMLLVVSL